MQEVQKGVRGENLVAATLAKYSNLDAHIIRNFPLRNESDTGYYQIDVVLVCNRGVFALEVKNWECIVECSPRDIYWKTIYPNREIMVKSPFLQNRVHCTALCKLLKTTVSNVVVFSDKTTIRNPFQCVISCLDIGEYLTDFPVVYQDAQIQEIVEKLLAYKKEHDEGLFVDFFCKGLLNHNKM